MTKQTALDIINTYKDDDYIIMVHFGRDTVESWVNDYRADIDEVIDQINNDYGWEYDFEHACLETAFDIIAEYDK